MPACNFTKHRLFFAIALLVTITVSSLPLYAGPMSGNKFVQHNLVSDLPGMAVTTDPDLVNPWGIALSSGSPFWISDNGTGLATLYNGAGVKQGLVVTVPPGAGNAPPSAPTGQVFNPTMGFHGTHFIFATEDGSVAGWSGGSSAAMEASGAAGSVYKGLTIDGNSLFVANFGLGRIDVFDSNFSPMSTSGDFTDPALPAGYVPFNIQNLGGKLYVTYALSSGGTDEVDGAGLGFVDVFDSNGNFLGRVGSQGALNAPWGLTLAPTGFGKFGGDLLVGNFGDGTINVFDPNGGGMLGTLDDASGNPIVNEGLWGLTFGNGGNGGDKDKLYFTAGIPGPDSVEDHGLFASLAFVPEPGSIVLLAAGLIGILRFRRIS